MRYTFMRFPGGKGKAVTLSYDDNSVYNKRFSDVITKYGLKCTFNLNSQKSNEMFNAELTVEDAKEYIINRGHEVAVHGAFHKGLSIVRPIEGIRDVLDCRIELEKSFGRIIRGMAYPDKDVMTPLHQNSYEKVKANLESLDIVYARRTEMVYDFSMPTDWYNWKITTHHNKPEAIELAKKFVELDLKKLYVAAMHPRLFFMYGHTYEFERKDNWERLDEICEIIANHDDIWYATNIEIYDYTKAYESLVWNAEGNMVYNPTLFEIWFELDEKLYSIKSGETITIREE